LYSWLSVETDGKSLEKNSGTGVVVQVVECLPSKREALLQSPVLRIQGQIHRGIFNRTDSFKQKLDFVKAELIIKQ
jgi:hypothetical protein